MTNIRSLLTLAASIGLVASQGCPYGHTAAKRDIDHETTLEKRAIPDASSDILSQFKINDTDTYLTSDVGGPMEDQNSLSAGERGPTLLEDFIFRQKITHFDHERVRQFLDEEFLLIFADISKRFLNARSTLEVLVSCSYAASNFTVLTMDTHRGSWCIRIVRRLVKYNSRIVPQQSGKEDANLCTLLNGCWQQR